LTTYGSLNTPLPFIIFGGLDYLFGEEAVPGRVLNFILSLVIIWIIGWPSQEKGGRALLSLIGLFLCPYFVGFYLVIPEFILFRPVHPLRTLKAHRTKYIAIAVGLLIFCLIFPPRGYGSGNLMKVGKSIPISWLHGLMFYSLALLAGLRFSKPDLFFWLILFTSLIMVKAWPWDCYVLPLAVVFWYMRSINYPDLVASYTVAPGQGYTAEQGGKEAGG
jgi:hypothetical protein